MNDLDSTATMVVGGVLSWGTWRHPSLSGPRGILSRIEGGKGGAVCAQHRGYSRKGRVISLHGEDKGSGAWDPSWRIHQVAVRQRTGNLELWHWDMGHF